MSIFNIRLIETYQDIGNISGTYIWIRRCMPRYRNGAKVTDPHTVYTGHAYADQIIAKMDDRVTFGEDGSVTNLVSPGFKVIGTFDGYGLVGRRLANKVFVKTGINASTFKELSKLSPLMAQAIVDLELEEIAPTKIVGTVQP